MMGHHLQVFPYAAYSLNPAVYVPNFLPISGAFVFCVPMMGACVPVCNCLNLKAAAIHDFVVCLPSQSGFVVAGGVYDQTLGLCI